MSGTMIVTSIDRVCGTLTALGEQVSSQRGQPITLTTAKPEDVCNFIEVTPEEMAALFGDDS